MQRLKISPLNKLLNELASDIDPKHLRQMKFLLSDHISAYEMERCSWWSSRNFFQIIKHKCLIGEHNVDLLEELFNEIDGLAHLKTKVQEFRERTIDDGDVIDISQEQISMLPAPRHILVSLLIDKDFKQFNQEVLSGIQQAISQALGIQLEQVNYLLARPFNSYYVLFQLPESSEDNLTHAANEQQEWLYDLQCMEVQINDSKPIVLRQYQNNLIQPEVEPSSDDLVKDEPEKTDDSGIPHNQKKIYEKKQTADKEKKKITSCGSASDSSDDLVEKKLSKEDTTMDEPRRATKSEMSDKLKVVLLCSEWGSSKGGLCTFNRQLSCDLAKRSDLEVLCFVPKVLGVEGKDAEENKVTLVEAEYIPGDPLDSLKRWPMQRPPPDVIISHGRKFGSAAFFIKNSYPSCKWVHFVHVNYEEIGKYKVGDDEIGSNNQKYSEELFWCEKADVVVAVGPQLLDSYRRSLSIKQKEVEIFYPGLSNEFLNLPVQNVKSEEFHILLCCRCSLEDFEVKGVDIMADAVGKLGKKYKMNIVGVVTNEEGNMLRHIRKQTAATKNQLYVREYCKSGEELKRKICAVDLVVMPSRAEAFGLIGLEALSAGVPLLVSANSGFGMTLQELDFGHNFVVESDESEEWAKKIESVAKKKSRSIREINSIRNQYGEIYKWEDQCSRLVNLFGMIEKN